MIVALAKRREPEVLSNARLAGHGADRKRMAAARLLNLTLGITEVILRQ